MLCRLCGFAKTKKQDARTTSRAPYLYLKDSSAMLYPLVLRNCLVGAEINRLSEASSGIGPFCLRVSCAFPFGAADSMPIPQPLPIPSSDYSVFTQLVYRI